MDGRSLKWLRCDFHHSCRQAGLVPQRSSRSRERLTWGAAVPSMILILSTPFSLRCSNHGHPFCLATQYLCQGKGQATLLLQKRKEPQHLKSGRALRERCCHITPLFYSAKDAARPNKGSCRLGSQGWRQSWTEVWSSDSERRVDAPPCALAPHIPSCDHKGRGSKRPP